MTRRGQRGVALAIGGVLALVFAAMAAVQVAAWSTGGVERTTHQVIPGPVERLTVAAGHADVLVVPADGDDLRVDTTIEGPLHTPELRAVKSGPEVRLDGECPQIGFGPCRADIVVHVPAGTAVDVEAGTGDLTASDLSGRVRLKTGSGDVNANGLSGQVELKSSSGDVDAEGLSGAVSLRTSSGDVSAANLMSRRVDAVTSSGDVDLVFARSPSAVDATTGSGDVTVLVPQGETYRVESDTGSGDSVTEVRTDPSSANLIRAHAGSGDAMVAYVD